MEIQLTQQERMDSAVSVWQAARSNAILAGARATPEPAVTEFWMGIQSAADDEIRECEAALKAGVQ